MKRTPMQLFALILALLLAVSLFAACDDGEGNGTGTTADEETTPGGTADNDRDTSTEETTTAAKPVVTVPGWDGSGSYELPDDVFD